jgi:hypothetical protein
LLTQHCAKLATAKNAKRWEGEIAGMSGHERQR